MKIIPSRPTKLNMITNLVMLMLSLYGIGRQKVGQTSLTFFEKGIVQGDVLLQHMGSGMKSSIANWIDQYFFLVHAKKENIFLSQKVQELESTLRQMEEIKRENERLKDFFEYGKELGFKKILARVIGRDISGNFKVIRINKGTADGIHERSPVVTTRGLVGYIYRATSHAADVLTILDQNNKVDVFIQETRFQGILEGYSAKHCLIKYIPNEEVVSNGQIVLTAGIGSLYPKGLVVGKITKIKKEVYGITQQIEVTPEIVFKNLEEVIILEKQETVSEHKI